MPQESSESGVGRKSPDYVNTDYTLSEITGKIISAAYAVHHELGSGYEELIYQRALALELVSRNLDFSREVSMDIHYRGARVGRKRVDFLIEDVMVEIKAKGSMEDVDFIQALSYLKASGYEIGLLLNFGGKSLEIKRLINQVKRRET